MTEGTGDDEQQQVASDPTTSAQQLEALSAIQRFRVLVAGNLAAPASLLERLARDPDERVRAEVASNPGTPWKTLEDLAWEFPRAFLQHPRGPLQMATHPEEISVDEAFWSGVLRETSIPSRWWRWLNRHPVLKTIQAVRLHVQYAGEIAHFSTDPQREDTCTRLALVELLSAICAQGIALSLPVEWQAEEASIEQVLGGRVRALCPRTDTETKQVLASSAYTPAEILSVMASDTDDQIRILVAHNQHTPSEPLLVLTSDPDQRVRDAVARNQDASAEALQILAHDSSEWIRVAVACNERTPSEILLALASDANQLVRHTVAWNKHTSAETLQILAHDSDILIRRMVAVNPHTPVETLQILARDADKRVRRTVSRNRSIEVLQALRPQEFVSVRRAIGSHRQAPAEILHSLASDTEVQVRGAVAGNLQTPVEVLQILASDAAKQVRKAVAENPHTPPELLSTLIQDTEKQVRKAVAENLHTPSELLLRLAQDRSVSVRRVVASRLQTSEEVLWTLMQERDLQVRQAVASNEWTPREILKVLARDVETRVREGVAVNPHTPDEILRVLAHDDDIWVRFLAQGSHQWVAENEELSSAPPGKALLHKPLTRYRRLRSIDDPVAEIQAVEFARLLDAFRPMLLAALAASWDNANISRTFGPVSTSSFSVRQWLYQKILLPFLPPLALQKLAASPSWEIRSLVALHAKTPRETRLVLSQDGNRYVRALTRAQPGITGEHISGGGDAKDVSRFSHLSSGYESVKKMLMRVVTKLSRRG